MGLAARLPQLAGLCLAGSAAVFAFPAVPRIKKSTAPCWGDGRRCYRSDGPVFLSGRRPGADCWRRPGSRQFPRAAALSGGQLHGEGGGCSRGGHASFSHFWMLSVAHLSPMAPPLVFAPRTGRPHAYLLPRSELRRQSGTAFLSAAPSVLPCYAVPGIPRPPSFMCSPSSFRSPVSLAVPLCRRGARTRKFCRRSRPTSSLAEWCVHFSHGSCPVSVELFRPSIS